MEQEIETLTRTVRIPGSDQHAGHHLITVTVLWECPQCGGPRGDVGRAISYDVSRQLSCDGWTNPRGHVAPGGVVDHRATGSSSGSPRR